MKIAFITDGLYPDTIGGIQKYSTELIRAFSMAGCDVDVYLQYDAPLAKQALAEAKGVRFIPSPMSESDRLPGSYLRKIKRFSEAVFQQIGKDNSVDVVYAQGFTGWYAGCEDWQAEIRRPVFLNLHGLEMYQAAKGLKARAIQWYFRAFVGRMLRRDNPVVVLGERLRKMVLGINASLHVYTIPNGINPEWLRTSNTQQAHARRRFLFVGRYEWRKGVSTLHAALKLLGKEDITDWEMHFVGDILVREQIKSPRIFYHGMVKNTATLAAHFQAADVLVCPSYSEGMPTVILEAMAAGLAIIATDVGASGELVNEQNGLLIPPFDPNEIYGAMVQMVGLSQEEITVLKKASMQRIENEYQWGIIAKKHMDVFEKEIGDMRKSRQGN